MNNIFLSLPTSASDCKTLSVHSAAIRSAPDAQLFAARASAHIHKAAMCARRDKVGAARAARESALHLAACMRTHITQTRQTAIHHFGLCRYESAHVDTNNSQSLSSGGKSNQMTRELWPMQTLCAHAACSNCLVCVIADRAGCLICNMYIGTCSY
jgi:hypothetical protein